VRPLDLVKRGPDRGKARGRSSRAAGGIDGRASLGGRRHGRGKQPLYLALHKSISILLYTKYPFVGQEAMCTIKTCPILKAHLTPISLSR
jgi:hypothetical protein